ncbi:MAG TPA: right-handed parallel beta-helix repeat-containing protein [Streptosporangiaceae bacterium]
MNSRTSIPAGPEGARPGGSARSARLLPESGRARLAGAAVFLITVGAALSVVPSLPASATTQTNCAAVPSACGYPDATNTGVLAGTTLKRVPSQVSRGRGWHYDPRGFVEVNGDGAVLRGLYIRRNLDITASNVTINNVKVVNSGQSSFGISLRHTRNVTIQNSTISGLNADSGRLMVGVKDVYGDASGTVVKNNDIYFTSTGVQLSAGLIQDNYIHDPGLIPGDHVNGTTSNGGTNPLTIQHNTIFNNLHQCDAISLFQDFGPQGNRLITDNLLAGGGYTIYAGGRAGAPPPFNIVITNNKISNLYFATGGYYGPVAYWVSGNGNVWSGNTWDATGLTTPAPN